MKLMLASAIKDTGKLDFPVLASPKLDGIRAVVLDGKVYSRAMKLIPNLFIQDTIGKANKHFNLHGLDGELIVGPMWAKDVFQRTTSAVMSIKGEPAFTFCAFDWVHEKSYASRQQMCATTAKHVGFIKLVPQMTINDEASLLDYEQQCLSAGYEGVMVRENLGAYKHGRSTLKEGLLLKLKRFEDGEAEVLGMTELMHNGNEAELDNLGHQVRSSKKAGMKGKGTMGSLIVRDLKTGVEFEIGTGFNEEDRAWWWERSFPLERGWKPVAKYKYQPTGVKDKPRFPVYLGLRDRRDMS